jgi:hypothetical protein
VAAHLGQALSDLGVADVLIVCVIDRSAPLREQVADRA